MTHIHTISSRTIVRFGVLSRYHRSKPTCRGLFQYRSYSVHLITLRVPMLIAQQMVLSHYQRTQNQSSCSLHCEQSTMKLYIYRGLDGERVPRGVTHVIVDDSVTVIKEEVFSHLSHLVSIIMGDNVKIIERYAFHCCTALRFARLSKTLESIEVRAFDGCDSLEALFLPSTVNSIEDAAFWCTSLRLLMLPNDIDLRHVGCCINYTAIYRIAETAGSGYNNDDTVGWNRRLNEWLYHHMDESPFHKLCYSSSVTTKHINDHLDEYGNQSALQIDPHHGMTPLHMLTMNPYAPADSIASLLDSKTEAFFCLDNQQKTPLEYARKYNVGGLVGMVAGLCNYRNSSIHVRSETTKENSSKRRRIKK